MRVYVGLISSDTDLIKEFNAVKESLIPKAIRDKLPKKCDFKFDAFNPLTSRGKYTVDSHILQEINGFDYATCLITEDIESYCDNIRYAILSTSINPSEVKNGNIHNFFSSRLAKLFKSVMFTMEKMD